MVKKTTQAVFWTAAGQAPAQYPWLSQNAECEIAVVGGGLTACLCALRFAQAGYDTVMVGAEPVGYGGTAASSGMMGLDAEGCLSELVEKIGADRAMAAVRLFREAIDRLEALCRENAAGCAFRRMDTLRYAQQRKGAEVIRQEFSLRLHNGIDAELLSAHNAAEQFTFPMEAGVYSRGAGAQTDPYRLAHTAAALAAQAGARIYENTGVSVVDHGEEGKVRLECGTGHTVNARYAVIAAGLDTDKQCGGLERTATAYTVVTEPVEEFSGWRGPCIIHTQEEPHLSLTVTPDNRILIGGTGSALVDEHGRLAGVLDLSSAGQKRYEQLEKRLRAMFPAIRGITAEYVYASRVGRTGDGLPVIGRLPQEDRIAYALCCGENGPLYAEIASRLLVEQYQGRGNQDLGLFSPRREWRVKH
ncbi:MAG TPA: FAD-binding oxidoreductase [Firmicutes bacterium]|nr:FAD-binding oxidoreductase [Bacillota bacterium]